MNPTQPVNPAQRIDQTWSGGALVEEVVHGWPEDGTAIRRAVNADGTITIEALTGLPIPQPPQRTPEDRLAALQAVLADPANADPVGVDDLAAIMAGLRQALAGGA